jgi:hypothetical protein
LPCGDSAMYQIQIWIEEVGEWYGTPLCDDQPTLKLAKVEELKAKRKGWTTRIVRYSER